MPACISCNSVTRSLQNKESLQTEPRHTVWRIKEMLFRQMNYFVRIVECGSFTEAAEQCYISQSAISQQMAALETELDVRLFERSGRKCRLTPAGEYFYIKSKSILASVEEMRAETVRMGTGDTKKLSIGYLGSYYGDELQNAIVAFSGVYPAVAVHVFKGSHEELYRALKSGRADLVMNDQRRAFSDEYENYILAQAPAYIDVAASSPLADGAAVTLKMAEHIPCILVADREEEKTEQQFYEQTLGIGREFLFAPSLDEARLMTMGGRGFMLVDSTQAETVAPLIRKEIRREDGSPIVRTYCAFWRKKRANPFIEAFAAILRNEFAKPT